MPIEPVKIPQNVYIEDRIVGPLTLRQLLITMGGGGISYMIYGIATRAAGGASILITIVSWIPLVIAFAFAFIRVNDLSLMKLLFLTLERSQNPPVRTWNPRTGLVIRLTTTPKEEKPASLTRLQQAEAMNPGRRIQELSNVVDRGIGPDPENDHDEHPVTETNEDDVADQAVPVSGPAQAQPQPSTLPVDKDRVRVDRPQTPGTYQLSDLSVFRDIFNPQDRG